MPGIPGCRIGGLLMGIRGKAPARVTRHQITRPASGQRNFRSRNEFIVRLEI